MVVGLQTTKRTISWHFSSLEREAGRREEGRKITEMVNVSLNVNKEAMRRDVTLKSNKECARVEF